jgi:hypothetical protein
MTTHSPKIADAIQRTMQKMDKDKLASAFSSMGPSAFSDLFEEGSEKEAGVLAVFEWIRPHLES